MDQVHARRIYDAVRNCNPDFGGELKLLYIVSCDACYPPDDEAMRTVSECRALGIDVLSVEAAGPGLLVAGQVYDDIYAVSLRPDNVPAVAAARYLQRQLAADSLIRPEERLLPASTATSLLKRWEGQVSLVFGPRFAEGLMEKACSGQSCGHMTAENLQRVRRHLVTATCGCIDFTEST